MKKILFSVAVLTCTTAVFAQEPAAPAANQKKVSDVAKFNSETINLGKIKQGTPTKGTFVVSNVSGEPLIIEQANPTCGCTISDYTKAPISAGKTGEINATYNAANAGHFDKHLTVKFAGVDEMKSITLTGDVLTAEEYDKWKAENDAKVKAATNVAPESAKTTKKTTKTTTTKKTTTKKSTTAVTPAP